MVVKILISMLLMTVMSACSVINAEPVSKIALLAPFEGQYREIGYDALYSVRLAIAESNVAGIDLLAIDDGSTIELASKRIEALNQDPTVVAIIALGPYSTSTESQLKLDNTHMLVVGYWGHSVAHNSVYMLASSNIETILDNSDSESEYIFGGELFGLTQTPLLAENIEAVRVVSSSTLPNATFRENYLASAEFASEPGLFSTLTYDATNIILKSIQTSTPISEIEYEGINGLFHFEENYWVNTPIHIYRYEDSSLVEIPD